MSRFARTTRVSTTRIQSRARGHARDVTLSRWDLGTETKRREVARQFADWRLGDHLSSHRAEYVAAFASTLDARS